MNLQKLPKKFTGKGEVKNFEFEQVLCENGMYIYRVTQKSAKTPHYEAFKANEVPICIDFENRVYSDTDFKEVYPKSKDFGVTAWSANSLENAKKRIDNVR